MDTPKTLNGYPVLGTGPSNHGTDALTVMVDRGREYPRYVVATWSPNCGDTWTWGNYRNTFAQACQTFANKCPTAAVMA